MGIVFILCGVLFTMCIDMYRTCRIRRSALVSRLYVGVVIMSWVWNGGDRGFLIRSLAFFSFFRLAELGKFWGWVWGEGRGRRREGRATEPEGHVLV